MPLLALNAEQRELSHHIAWPWKGVDAVTLPTLLERQGNFASAFEKAARR